ncbi:hypothetical protein Acid345_0539 [Candidatus Koribacter versatilis Ellin345]|uniref:DUF3857 domain-containing protein n=1 Tax=Koribacter versatilis (strain Ellin345) TaxID=204669 RepID=Q1IUA6_KORVE|nr:DUF3857 and transglutaminase domain-containing protein [Candidatus Koribacter versatilis]ABF39544.1 hypothetical protein Acid345_0539 [Candidatus Koribacter versatilis Ellin345]
MSKLYSRWEISRRIVLVLGVLLLIAVPASAGDSVPDWFRQLAHAPLPKYSDEANAVVLLHDEAVTVRDNGDMYVNVRRAVKVLRPKGKEEGVFVVQFDKDRKIESLKAWSISPNGQEYELKEKDAIEGSPYEDALYDDHRVKVIKVPAVEVGSYVAVEYQQKRRPNVYSDRWDFQENVPVKTARFTINLPSSWEYQYRFSNWAEQKPQNIGANNWLWEVHDIEGISEEPDMPYPGSLAGMMAVTLFSSSIPQATPMKAWSDVAKWANTLNASRRVTTPKMQAKVAELIAGKTDAVAKIHAIASYVQHNVRYVEISIGKVGGWQSHMAGDTFANGYGDCKDKATLLVTMLQEAGIESYLALVDSERGVVNPAVPTPWTFDHMIVAIKIPSNTDATSLFARVDDPKLGPLLIFDPTDDMTPFGLLHSTEQDSYALLVTGDSGELVKMPLLAPSLNRLLRVAHLQLTPEGALNGEVEEIRWGYEASVMRARLVNSDRDKRVKVIEEFLSEFLDRSQLTYASIQGLDKYDEALILRYKFEAPDYAKTAGDLLLVRPRVLGSKSSSIAEDKKRKYPVTLYPTASMQSDMIEIKLPAGFKVDELPEPTQVTAPFAEYKSKVEAKDNVLSYSRTYTVKDLVIPVDQLGALQKFMRGIAADERNTAVLKKTP